jgi:hypothetical protein
MRERIHAPDFSFVKSWLNAGRPISIRELRGQVVVLDAAVAPGEPDPDVLESFIARELAEGRANGTLAKAPLRFGAGPDGAPSKEAATQAALDDPQGLALDGDALYIADARAHAIWRADLKARTVSRLAGTFELGRAPLAGTGKASETPLRSPWDLALRGHTLLIALAGSHQLAALDLREGTLSLLAGSGREALQDGPAREAALAQPSGLSLSGATLFIADSESSAMRALDLDGGQIGTLAVLATPEGVLVADTNNHRLVAVAPDGASARVIEVVATPPWTRGESHAAGGPSGALPSAAGWFTALLDAPPGVGLSRGSGRIVLEVRAPEGFELAEGAPWSAQLEVSRRSDLLRLSAETVSGQSPGGAAYASRWRRRPGTTATSSRSCSSPCARWRATRATTRLASRCRNETTPLTDVTASQR